MVPTIATLEDFEKKLPGFLISSKKLAVLLDYDGTLAPITDDPSKTVMPTELELMLNKISKHPNIFVAVISGRSLKDVQACVGINGITYAGNHGLEIEYPNGSRHDFELPKEIQHTYRALVTELKEKLAKNQAWVEDKDASLTYHYRDTPTEFKELQKSQAFDIIKKYGFRANQAHEAVEAKPPVNWNKGEAALFILKNKFGANWNSLIKAVFVGDDTTDEDAMRILQGLGKSFRISDDPEVQTYADFRLPCQSVVTEFLKWISCVYSTGG